MTNLTTREVIGWTMALGSAGFGVLAVGLKTKFAAFETITALSGAMGTLAAAWVGVHYMAPK